MLHECMHTVLYDVRFLLILCRKERALRNQNVYLAPILSPEGIGIKIIMTLVPISVRVGLSVKIVVQM